MSDILIPTDSTPYYNQRTSLDGKEFEFRFRYNLREDRWYVSLYNSDGKLLIAGIKLVVDFPLLMLHQYNEEVPQGTLIVRSNTLDDSDPGLLDLAPGARCTLVYLEAET